MESILRGDLTRNIVFPAIHRADPFRMPVQHRGPRDDRERSTARGHDLLRGDRVFLHVPRPQHHRAVRRDMGRLETVGQSAQHTPGDIPVPGHGRQLRNVPDPGSQVRLRMVPEHGQMRGEGQLRA